MRVLRSRLRPKMLALWGMALASTCCSYGGHDSQAASVSDEPSPSTSPEPAVIVWRNAIDVATGDAFAGPWRMNESEFHYVDDPSVALAEQGSAICVVWADNRRKDVFFRAYDPEERQRLEAPVNVSRTPRIFSWLPRLVMAPGGEVFVLWQEIVFSGGTHGGEIFFSVRRSPPARARASTSPGPSETMSGRTFISRSPRITGRASVRRGSLPGRTGIPTHRASPSVPTV